MARASGVSQNLSPVVGGLGVAVRRYIRQRLGIYNVKDYGAKGDGSTDDTAAIQSAINAAIVGTTTDSRTVGSMSRVNARGIVFLPAGTYIVSSTLKVYAAFGFRMEGAGRLATEIKWAATGTTTKLLDVDDCTQCDFGHLSLNGGLSATNYPTTVLNVDAVTAVAPTGSSQDCHFYDIYVQGTFVDGVVYGGSGTGNSQDVFKHCFTNVTVAGSQPQGTWNTATLWQNAFRCGNAGASAGNVLSPRFDNCQAGLCVNGLNTAACGAVWIGGAFEANKVDLAGLKGDIIIVKGVRGEGSGALVIGGSGTTVGVMSLEDIRWTTHAGYYASQQVIQIYRPGFVRVANVECLSDSGDTAANMAMAIGGNTIVEITGLGLQRNDQVADTQTWFTANGGTYTIRHFSAIKTDGTGNAGTTFAGPHSSGGRTATAVSYTATVKDRIVGVTSTAAARTITLPNVNNLYPAEGRSLTIKDESGAASVNNITVQGTAGQTIDGAATKVINTNYGVLRVYTDGGAWFTA